MREHARRLCWRAHGGDGAEALITFFPEALESDGIALVRTIIHELSHASELRTEDVAYQGTALFSYLNLFAGIGEDPSAARRNADSYAFAVASLLGLEAPYQATHVCPGRENPIVAGPAPRARAGAVRQGHGRAGTGRLESGTRINAAVEQVASVADDTSAATEQVSASAQQPSATSQHIATSSEELASMSHDLEELGGKLTRYGMPITSPARTRPAGRRPVKLSKRAVGLIVDSVDEVLLLPSEKIEPIPVGDAALGDHIAKLDNRPITLVDPQRVIGEALPD